MKLPQKRNSRRDTEKKRGLFELVQLRLGPGTGKTCVPKLLVKFTTKESCRLLDCTNQLRSTVHQRKVRSGNQQYSSMASLRIPFFQSELAPLRRILTLPLLQTYSRFNLVKTRSILPPPFTFLRLLTLLPSGIPSLLSDIWESILRAVPKKKTTHSKSRMRRMAGKALQDVTALVRCPACGKVKRAHVLCQSCVEGEKWTDSAFDCWF